MKMLLKRNLLENITIIANSGTLICVLIQYLTDISLLSGKWFLLYITIVFIVSVIFSFKVIQWFLHLNKPISYDIDALVKNYSYLAPLRGVLPELPKRVQHEWKDYDTNELSVISTVLERKLVSSWYVPYISQEIGFPFACKQMLDQMIGKAFRICNNIETKDVFVDICTILTLHLKEYDKAVKRQEKSPSSSIESLYNKSYATSDSTQNCTSMEHYTNILRIIIKELLPWELRDTPHSELLVRILAKKLDSYIDSTLADPAWLNDKLLTYLTGEEYVELKQEELKKEDKNEETVPKEEESETVVPHKEVAKEVKEETQSITESVVEDEITPEVKDVKSSPVLRQKRGRQGRNEVKIYDRIIEGSVKTWETDMDLQCISLGQDLLASLDGEITLSRLWGHEEPEGSPEAGPEVGLEAGPEAGGKSPQLWAGEEDALEFPVTPTRHSPKPADALLKDLQASVSSAKHKIGDLQVKEIDVSNASDEAAGMMEGLLDFGIAGLKKGLRFTGLSDDSQEKCQFPGRASDKSPPLEWHKPRPEVPELAIAALMHKEDNGNGIPHLVKQHHVSSQDSVAQQSNVVGLPREGTPPVFAPAPGSAGAESPEPQYEEAADLSTSIAKLRRLLRQRAEAGPNQPRAEEVWWGGGEGAEETRGRTQRRGQHSARPVDTATLADEYDMSMERNSPNQASNNNMQRLDKLFQRTVTGVFNSLKTAVCAEEEAPPPTQQWAYVHTNNELSVCVVAARLAWSRRARGVEHALDSLQLQTQAEPRPAPQPEDLEEWLSVRARAFTACSAAARALHSHVAHRLLALLCADIGELIISCWLEEMSRWLRDQIFLVFSRMEEGATVVTRTNRPLDLEHTCDVIMDKIPVVSAILGSERARAAVSRGAGGAGHAALTRLLVRRLLDALALHYSRAAARTNPSFDTN